MAPISVDSKTGTGHGSGVQSLGRWALRKPVEAGLRGCSIRLFAAGKSEIPVHTFSWEANMADTLDRLLDQYDQGLLSRRQLLKGLALATGGVLAGGAGLAEAAEAQSSTPLARAMSINHVHLYVKDMARTVDFYSGVLGAKLTLDQPTGKRMSFPGAKPGSGVWISISPGKADSADPATRPGVINHAAYGVTASTAEINRIMGEIKKRFPDVPQPPVTNADGAGYFYDPDHISVQLIQMDNNGVNINPPKK